MLRWEYNIKCILEKQGLKEWTGMNCFKIGSNGQFSWTRRWTFRAENFCTSRL